MKINQATVVYKLEDGTELKVPANELISHNGLWLVGNGYKDSFVTWNQKYISNFLHLQTVTKKLEKSLSSLEDVVQTDEEATQLATELISAFKEADGTLQGMMTELVNQAKTVSKVNEDNLSLLINGLSSTFKIAIENFNKLEMVK